MKFQKYYAHNRGIYGLLFTDHIIYIGSTIAAFGDRRRAHFNDMAYGFHSNYEVQVRYNLYGFPEFVVIENMEGTKRAVRERECAVIDEFDKAGWKVLNLIRKPA